MTGRAKEGLEWIDGKEAAWQHCNNFRYHVWWHIALMHLDLCNYDKVLELYDENIRKDKTDDYRDISNATSVLLRLEFEDVDVGDRWQELSSEKRHHHDLARIIHEPGVLAATGLEAFRDENFTIAYDCLTKARPTLQAIGGSHAQRDVFERLAIESALRGGLITQATHLLHERDLHRGHKDGYSDSRWRALKFNSYGGGAQHIAGVAAKNVA